MKNSWLTDARPAKNARDPMMISPADASRSPSIGASKRGLP
jgi:hypothetical protein